VDRPPAILANAMMSGWLPFLVERIGSIRGESASTLSTSCG
jgi:hypothetical protein